MKHITSSALSFFFVILCFSLVLGGCKKNEEQPVPIPTNSEKILGTWTLTSELQDQNINGLFVEVLNACDLDDTWAFTSDGIVTTYENSLKCFFTFTSYTRDWKMQEEETVLHLSYGHFSSVYKIATLNDSILVLHRPLDGNDIHGIVYSKITLKR